MKILYLTSSCPYPPETGGQIRSFHLLKYLAGKGQVTLICPGESTDEKELNLYCEKVVFVDPEKFGPHSKDKQKLFWKGRILNLFNWQPWYLHDFISEEFRKSVMDSFPEKFDLIILRYPQLGYYFFKDKTLQKFLDKVIIDVDDITLIMQERRLGQMKFGYEKLRHSLEFLMIQKYFKNLRKARACFSVSVPDKRYLEARGLAKKVFVIPNTISVNGHVPPQDSKNMEILFCGMLSFAHNEQAVFYFVDQIFPKIKNAIPNVKFTVIGKNPTERILKLNLMAGVSVVGQVPSTEPYYQKASIAVVPLLNGAGTRIKILEAMAYGCPVVSTVIGAEGLEVTDGENIAIGDDADTFASKCIDLLQDEERRNEMTSRAYAFVKENHDVPVFSKKMDECFEFVGNSHV
jgi:glycosyltransferase involved in cell wall biosynthesis